MTAAGSSDTSLMILCFTFPQCSQPPSWLTKIQLLVLKYTESCSWYDKISRRHQIMFPFHYCMFVSGFQEQPWPRRNFHALLGTIYLHKLHVVHLWNLTGRLHASCYPTRWLVIGVIKTPRAWIKLLGSRIIFLLRNFVICLVELEMNTRAWNGNRQKIEIMRSSRQNATLTHFCESLHQRLCCF